MTDDVDGNEDWDSLDEDENEVEDEEEFNGLDD
jgi:hypothetical protein